MGVDPKCSGARSVLGKQSKAGARRILGIVCFAALMRPEAPGAEVDGVEGDAEEIGGDKAELGRAGADDADDGAIDGGNDPALPELLAEQNGTENSQDAGDVIQANEGVEHVGHVFSRAWPDTTGRAGQASDSDSFYRGRAR